MSPFSTDKKCSVTRQSKDTISKSGSRVRLEEVEALKFARTLGLPVPAVHEAHIPPDGDVEISMDFVQGECLELVWTKMTTEEKNDIAQQLGKMISLLRTVTQAQVRIGACGGPARDCRRYSQYSGGPFFTETDFNDFLLDLYAAASIPIQQALRKSLSIDHRIVFTHNDLSPRNIIVSNGRITGLLDWEMSGWYPEYWEFVKFFECVPNCKDWKNFADTIIDTPYTSELLSYQALVRWQKP